MDEAKIAEARQQLTEAARELLAASEAARAAAGADPTEGWKQVQLLYTRFAAAEQVLRDMRRTVDAAFAGG